ncbi:60S ribosomal protein L4-like protein [Corchorus capsularis]|uniref:60S ribosomal protein L4-like protein n=1 Tax=Corchorus capsularis TaxID=210143 RepID=A0A1R3I883_COCAP|nr:60S ribosomal protein L4-like protein [Corchorus capsularis]
MKIFCARGARRVAVFELAEARGSDKTSPHTHVNPIRVGFGALSSTAVSKSSSNSSALSSIAASKTSSDSTGSGVQVRVL